MTVVPTTGGEVAPFDPDLANAGLEDIGVTDVVIPRIKIDHVNGRFVDALSKQEFDKLTVILLGLVKQRVMFDDDVQDGDRPQCKSPDFDHGFPNINPESRKDTLFPWDKSNFKPEDFPPENGLNNLPTLPCDKCIFQKWDVGGWKNPPCAEQHTYPLLYTPDEGESWITALLTLQKTGIKPSRQYISAFAQSQTPMFTVHTEITLTQQSRGTVKYAVPSFKRLSVTDRNEWGEYATRVRQIRDFIRQPPRNAEDDDTDGVTTEGDTAAPAPSSPAPDPTPVAQSAPAAAPAAPAAAAPEAQPAAPAAAAPQPAATPAAEPAASSDDDLPF